MTKLNGFGENSDALNRFSIRSIVQVGVVAP